MSYTYTGLWINWSHGSIVGRTLTLDKSNGGLLTAFLAVFVSAAGGATWSIISFALHQIRAKQEYQDGLHHQQQAIFRNSGSPVRTSWQMLQLAWYWRRNIKRNLIRTIPLAALAVLNLTLFGVAGVFSSQVTKAPGNKTLTRSENCGIFTLSTTASVEATFAYAAATRDASISAAAYQKACYDNPDNTLQCGHFIQRSLPWTSDKRAPCPFSPNMCVLGGNTAYRMDTGFIDSHEGLGINAPQKDRVQLRKVTTCAPIQQAGFIFRGEDSDIDSDTYGDTFLNFFYGDSSGNNITYQYNTHSSFEQNSYQLDPFYAGVFWNPIPALNRTDADVSLYFLASNGVLYKDRVDDPIFNATIPVNSETLGGTNHTYWTSSQYVNVLGCAEQYQICNPVTNRCTEFTISTPTFEREMPQIGLNDVQIITAKRMARALFGSVYNYVNVRRANALRASETLKGLVQTAVLPDNQWTIEVSTWFEISLAQLQEQTVRYATGPSYMSDDLEMIKPANQDEWNMCKNQISRSQSDTISFSMLGVTIILVIGSILIATSLVIDTLVGFIRRKYHRKEFKSLQWTLDEKLQLQRLAYEEAGQGEWTGCADPVPVTKKYDKIGVPKDVDEKHPRLSHTSGQPEKKDGDSVDSGETESLMT